MKKFDRKKRARQKAVRAITRIVKAAKELAEAEAIYHAKKPRRGGNDEQ